MSAKPKCKGDMWNGYTWVKCYRGAKVERDGKWYCGTHDPEAVAARRKKKEDGWAEERRARDATRSSALTCCAGLKCGIPSGEGVWLSLREADDLIARLEGRHT